MPIFEISWTIALQTNDESALEIPYGETALTEMYPSDRGAPASAEGVNIYISTDGGRQGQISISQRVTAGDARTARVYMTNANAFASQDGVVALINNSTIDVCVSLLTIVDIESGVSVVMDSGRYVQEAAPAPTPRTPRTRRGRPRAKPVVEETTTEEPAAEEGAVDDDVSVGPISIVEVENEESEEESSEESEEESSEESE